ncbi:hypothetical protein [Petrachloros mirabilis]
MPTQTIFRNGKPVALPLYTEIPTDAQILSSLREHINREPLFKAMERSLYSDSDAYPDAYACVDNVATTFFARGKTIEAMTDADFALIGGHMAQWFQRHFIEPMLTLEKDTVAHRIEDEMDMS